ncbi:MAG: class I SAM-dependent methyltransferase [Elusimicrobiota bacterium]|nr:MAG: class I SAM-dependent methyltransferase [Elusimicrobiota bacterium]
MVRRLEGARVLALASAGGQQGPLLAAAGAAVTVFDASPVQLGHDRMVSERDGLGIKTELGDMADLSRFADGSFDLIFHACSNCFVPAIRPVWNEAARVLRPGGRLLSGFCLPHWFLVDEPKDEKGVIDIAYRIPYTDDQLPADQKKKRLETKEPLVFGHTLEDQLAGQLDAGFVLTGFYEDAWEPGISAFSDRIACFAATLAIKRA